MRPTIRRVVAVLTASVLIPIVPFLVVGELPGDRWLERAESTDLGFGAAGAALLAADLLLPVPSSLLGTLLGARLGPVLGAVFSFFGLMTGAVLGFGLGRLFVHGRSAGAEVEPVAPLPSWFSVFLSRPVPVFAEAIAVSAGALGVPFRVFLAAAGAGNLIYSLVLALNGAYQFPDAMVGPGLLIPMVLPAVGYWAFRRFAGQAPKDTRSSAAPVLHRRGCRLSWSRRRNVQR